jgi:HupE / UreJ protein
MKPSALLCLLLIVLMPAAAAAHKPSDSYLTLSVENETIQGQWDIALRDLDHAVSLDLNDDGAITWGELQARHSAIAAYAMPRLALGADGSVCDTQVTDHLVDNHTDGAYAVLRFAGKCPLAPEMLQVGYDLFFGLDPQHRGLLRLLYGGETRSAIFSPVSAQQSFELASPDPWDQFRQFVEEGIWHIWIGFDHILFLISLLLPAVLRRVDGGWHAAANLRSSLWDVLKIVTSFSVAHSITLTLAALGFLTIPSRLVESAIAASIVVAALNNIVPVISRRLWMVSFGLGLVHGLGFANVLADLDLPANTLIEALLAFNLGVEIGQLAIVCSFIPLAYVLRRTWVYQTVILKAGSLAIAMVAIIWMLNRGLDMQLSLL